MSRLVASVMLNENQIYNQPDYKRARFYLLGLVQLLLPMFDYIQLSGKVQAYLVEKLDCSLCGTLNHVRLKSFSRSSGSTIKAPDPVLVLRFLPAE